MLDLALQSNMAPFVVRPAPHGPLQLCSTAPSFPTRARVGWVSKRKMRPIYDYVTFDCYGTLIDWEKGIAKAFVQAALTKQTGVE